MTNTDLRFIDGAGDRLTVDTSDDEEVYFIAASKVTGGVVHVALENANAVTNLRDALTTWLQVNGHESSPALTECCSDYQPATVGDADSGITWREAMERIGVPVVDDEPQTITAEAEAAVYGDRGDDYGHPREHYTRTAIMWTGALQHKLADGEYVDAEDVAHLYILDKVSRNIHKPKRDNRVDIAGYALCLDRLETGK